MRANAMRTGQLNLFTKRVRQAPAAKEIALHCQVADVIRDYGRPDWQITHFPSGEYRLPATAAKLQRMLVRPGWPDFQLIPPTGMFHGLELKRRGEDLNANQRAFEAWCNENRIPFAVVDCLEDALAVLQVWDAIRVRINPQ